MVDELVITFPFSPILARIGPVVIHWYGLCYAVAFIVGLWMVGRHLRSRGLSSQQFGDLAFWCILLGLIAARLYYDFQSGAGYYLSHPQYLLAVWQGGMAYFGAVFTVPILIYVYTRIRFPRVDFWVLEDAAALFAAIGQPIGRIGNIINGEGDVLGPPSNLPWAFRYTNPESMAPHLGVAYQPAGVYELLTALGILAILLVIRARIRPPAGTLLFLYVVLYAASQFGLFFLRDLSVTALGLKQAQLSSIAVVLLLIPVVFLWQRTRRRSDRPASEATTAGGAEADA